MISTDRLILKTPTESDINLLIQFEDENLEHFAPWSPERSDKFNTPEFWQVKLEKYRDLLLKDQQVHLFMYLKDESEIIGAIQITRIERGPFQSCTLGYKVSKKYEGQGYMSEALRAAIDYIFNTLRLNRIEAGIIPSNTKSIALIERLNFHRIGLSPNYLKIDGEFQDHLLFALTR